MRSSASSLRAAKAARVAPFLLALLAALLVWSAHAGAADNVVRTVSTKTIIVPAPRAPGGIAARTGIVLDAQTGVKLWGRGTTRRRLIASTTKMMTALVAISRTTPGEMITATNYQAGVGESLLGLKPGERMSAQDMIRGLLLESGNDAADSLAAGTASSRGAFVAAMNRRARAMGLTRTHFANPVGLDAAGNYSTASDLAQLAKQALTVPRFANVVDKAHLTLRTGSVTRHITNRNPLIGAYPWAIGVKTGHTMAAGYLLVGAAEKVDAKLVSVVTGEPTEADRENDSAALLKFGRAHYKSISALQRKQAIVALPVELQDITAKVYPSRDISLAARNGQRVVVQLTAPKEIKGPRSAGSIVGTAAVLRDGQKVGTVQVALARAVPAPATSAVMLHALGKILPFALLVLGLGLIGIFFFKRGDDRTRRPGYVG
ncbi:MAG: D-alanyl-D-alanine carboxypeptidase family protein [Solirubrobacterales bacterium]